MFCLLTDLNDINAGIARGLVEDAEGSRAIRPGDRVLLHDDGEHEAWGIVTNVSGGLVYARIDWDTWGAPGRYEEQDRGTRWRLTAQFNLARIGDGTLGGRGVKMPPRGPRAGCMA